MLGSEGHAFFVAAPLIAVTPGANQLLSLRNALQQGTGDAVVALSGRFSAFLLLVLATIAGLGGVLLASEPAFNVIKWGGVAYLLFVGGRLIYQSRSSESASAAGPGLSPKRTRWELTRQEFLVAVSNPKALLLFAALLPQFVDRASGAVPVQLAVLGIAYIAVEFVAALLYAGLGRALTSLDLTPRIRRLLDRATGASMIAIAVGLARLAGSKP